MLHHLYPQGRYPDIHWKVGWLGCRVGLVKLLRKVFESASYEDRTFSL